MHFHNVFFVASAALGMAGTTPVFSGNGLNHLQIRVQACDDLCKNNIGQCDDKSQCVDICNYCVNADFGFFPDHQCGCTDSDECSECEDCTQGCGSLDTDAAIAACYISCSTEDYCDGC